MNPRLWLFAGGHEGQFTIARMTAVRGDSLPPAAYLHVSLGGVTPEGAAFALRGVVSNERYTTRSEKEDLVSQQVALGRSQSSHGAFIALKKSDAWWALTQDERRAIFEDRSSHVQLGLGAVPEVARRLHHCRDLGEDAPFDFLTWFDFAEKDTQIFDDLLGALRMTEEWNYVEREVDIRVVRSEAPIERSAGP
jgi:chlorite dismutase